MGAGGGAGDATFAGATFAGAALVAAARRCIPNWCAFAPCAPVHIAQMGRAIASARHPLRRACVGAFPAHGNIPPNCKMYAPPDLFGRLGRRALSFGQPRRRALRIKSSRQPRVVQRFTTEQDAIMQARRTIMPELDLQRADAITEPMRWARR